MVQRRLRSPWFVAAPEKYSELRSLLKARYPTLHAAEEYGKIVVSGAYTVLQEEVEIDWYQIKVALPDEYPGWLPTVSEIGGRIPHELDRHVNGDGSLCIGVAEDLWLTCEGNFGLGEFLEGPVRSFLLRNSLVERGEEWPHGERPHGVDGICEFYREAVGIEEPTKVLQAMRYLSKDRLKGHWSCPCGSGKTMRACHFERMLKLHGRLPRRMIEASMATLERFEP